MRSTSGNGVRPDRPARIVERIVVAPDVRPPPAALLIRFTPADPPAGAGEDAGA